MTPVTATTATRSLSLVPPTIGDEASVLAASGSSRPEARAELDAAADDLARRLGRPVERMTMSEDVSARLAGRPAPLTVATYLLAEGQFVTRLHDAVGDRGRVSAPLGVHPALVRLVWRRYDRVIDGDDTR